MNCIRLVNRLSRMVNCSLAVLIRGPMNRIASIRRPVSHVMAFHRNGLLSGKLPPSSQPVQSSPVQNQPTPEEQRLVAEYQREQEAKIAPTSIRGSTTSQSSGPSFGSIGAPTSVPPSAADLSQVAALSRALVGNESKGPNAGDTPRALTPG